MRESGTRPAKPLFGVNTQRSLISTAAKICKSSTEQAEKSSRGAGCANRLNGHFTALNSRGVSSLLIRQPNADDMTGEDEVFATCLSKMSEMVGLPQEMLIQLVPEVTSSCANISHLAQVMYLTAQPLDLHRIAPRLAVPLYGVVSPVLIVVGFVLNVVLVVLLVRQQVQTPTSVLLGGMAVLDGLTGLLQLPFLLYAYAMDNHGNYLSMAWCRIYWYLCRLVPMAMHTASLWLTTLLALQRHLGVSRSSRRTRSKLKCVAGMTRVLCSIKGAAVAAVVCLFAAGVLHASQAAFLRLVHVKVVAKDVLTSDGLHVVDTCSLRLKGQSLYVAYNCVLTLVRLVLAELCPCVLIGTCNLLLVRTTRRSSRYRCHLVHGHRASMIQ
ncbi:hypothetical protein BaRGS_00018743, partial [Batillaria attramentaria]